MWKLGENVAYNDSQNKKKSRIFDEIWIFDERKMSFLAAKSFETY